MRSESKTLKTGLSFPALNQRVFGKKGFQTRTLVTSREGTMATIRASFSSHLSRLLPLSHSAGILFFPPYLLISDDVYLWNARPQRLTGSFSHIFLRVRCSFPFWFFRPRACSIRDVFTPPPPLATSAWSMFAWKWKPIWDQNLVPGRAGGHLCHCSLQRRRTLPGLCCRIQLICSPSAMSRANLIPHHLCYLHRRR